MGLTRRKLLAGAGVAGLGTIGTLAYRTAPGFWHQYFREFQRPIAVAPRVPDVASWPDTGLHAAWLGHASVLLKVDGYTILTDPVLEDRIGLDFRLFKLGLKRLVAPALTVQQLPPINLILLSHAHMDHMDLPTLRRLENSCTEVVMARKTSDLIRVDKYAKVTELGWEESCQAGPATIRGFAVKHWGARMRSDNWRGYNGYSIRVGRWRVLFGGDTAQTTLFRNVAYQGPFHFGIMPIGAYNPWIRNHCNPEQAWEMANDARVEFLMGAHHQTFQLSREPHHEPMERFCEAAGAAAGRVAVREIGGEFHLI